jgi:hypothetical protein
MSFIESRLAREFSTSWQKAEYNGQYIQSSKRKHINSEILAIIKIIFAGSK